MSEHANGQHDCGADAAAYAMGALEPAEAEAFRRHLESCAICQDEVASFGAVVDVLPLSATQFQAPGDLRRRVLREVRQQPRSARPSWEPLRRVRPLALGAGAAALLAAAVLGGTQLAGPGGPAPTHVYAASVGDAVVRVSADRAELIVRHLPQPGSGKVYEVWLQHGKQPPQPTMALFGVNRSGRGDVVIPGSVRGVSALLVTAEPAGGTSAPTSAPVVVAALS